MDIPALEINGLHKSFGDVVALDGLDLTVPRGGVHSILGPNGAGKSTLLRVLSTLIRPDNGSVTVLGSDVTKNPVQVRSRIAVTGQDTALDADLTGIENLILIGRLRGLKPAAARQRAQELVEVADLVDAGGRLVNTYSGGMRRRIDIVASLVVVPDLLFLDEPTTGLDLESRNRVWDTVAQLVDDGVTVLLTTQNLDEADRLAHQVVVLDRGKVVAEGTPDELKARIGSQVLQLTLADPVSRAEAERVIADTVSNEVGGERAEVSVALSDQSQATRVLQRLDENGVSLSHFALARPSLDEVFLSLTGKAPAPEVDVDQ